MPNLSFGSFCSGIGAPEVAWSRLGWRPQFFAEIEPFPSAVLAHHYPAVKNHGDMTRIDTATLPNADVWVAGTPCQAFSVAGLRRSLADDRGNLTLTFCRMIHEREPMGVVWENVPGVLSTKDNAFGCFLAGLVGEGQPLICGNGSWPNAGMAFGPRRTAAWRVLDAQFFGLAQRRRRVFVVSFRIGDGHNPGAVLFEPESVRRDSAPSRQTGARVADSVAKSLRGRSNPSHREDSDNYVVASTGDVSHCLNAGGMGRQDYETETLVTHSLRADGFDASEDGTGRGTPLVAHVIQAANKPSAKGGHGKGYNDGSICYTLLADEQSAVATLAIRGRESESRFEYRTDGLANALLTPNGGRAGIGIGAVQAGMAVRRLTPTECERLQGFPDGYTAVTFRGKPAADGPRYRALGNSMAVPGTGVDRSPH